MSDSQTSLGFLTSRRSIRAYRPEEVPPSLIDHLIDVARWAPSAHNAQPWRFRVIQRAGLKERLAREMAIRFQEDLERGGCQRDRAIQQADASIERFSTSPALIVACIDPSQMDRYPDATRKRAEEIMAAQSLAAALQNLLLAATACGLGACWYCAPLFCPDVVRKVLLLPDHYIPQALVTLGYPAETPAPPARLPVDEIRKID